MKSHFVTLSDTQVVYQTIFKLQDKITDLYYFVKIKEDVLDVIIILV